MKTGKHWIAGMAGLLACTSIWANDLVMAGWEALATNATVVAADIAGTASWGVHDGDASWFAGATRQCIDGTFGSLGEGAITNQGDTVIHLDGETTPTFNAYMEFTITNNGTKAIPLGYFSFDAWRAYGNQFSDYALSLIDGNLGVSSNFSTGTFITLGTIPPTEGANYADFDISLSALTNHTLEAGQTATFRLDFIQSGAAASGYFWVDNVAIIAADTEELLLAGWDRAAKTTSTNAEAAQIVAEDIEASALFSDLINGGGDASGDWNTRGNGCIDGTFGTYEGTNASINPDWPETIFCLNTNSGSYIDYTITNTGSTDYELTFFRFDAFKQWNASGTPTLSVLPGSDITEGDIATPDFPGFQRTATATGEDYTDLNIVLTGLADHTLAAGESATFRITMSGSGTYIDNVGLTGRSAGSAYGQWAASWGVDIGTETDDYDRDGLNNLYEYGLAGNPTNAQDQGTSPSFSEDGSTFTYVYPQLANPKSGLAYHLELRSDLVYGSWTNAGYSVTGTNVTGGTLDFVTNTTDVADDKKFIRLIIEM